MAERPRGGGDGQGKYQSGGGASASFQHSILYRGANPAEAKFVPQAPRRAPARYRAGQAPAFVQVEEKQKAQEAEEERKKLEQLELEEKLENKSKRKRNWDSKDDHVKSKKKAVVLGGLVQSRVTSMLRHTEFASAELDDDDGEETLQDRLKKRRRVVGILWNISCCFLRSMLHEQHRL